MNNNKNNNNNNSRRQLENLDMLDALSVISFMAQIQNIEEDNIETEFIHKVIKAIAEEINKLHKENDIIMEKLDKISNYLEGGK